MIDSRLLEIVKFFELNDIELKESIDSYHPYEISEIFTEISQNDRFRMYKIYTASQLAPVFEHLDKTIAIEYFDEMKHIYASKIIEEMNFDDSVDILKEMDLEDRVSYMSYFTKDNLSIIQQLIKYEEFTAGSLMTTDFLSVHIKSTVGEAMKVLIRDAVDVETIYLIYIVDDTYRLCGVLSLRELILARRDELIKDIMSTNMISVAPLTDQENVAETFKNYDFSSLPVVSHLGKIIGIITFDDIMDIIEDEAVEDYSKFAGVSDVEITEDETVLLTVKKRIPWLLVLCVLGFATAGITAIFEDTLTKIPTLAFFMSLILGMAGNTGTQALAVTVRGLNDDQFNGKSKIVKHLIRELLTGVINGIVIGLILFFISYMFMHLTGTANALRIAQVVSISIFVSLTVSTLAGALIPIIISAFKIDPAVASGPFVTVINDILALTVYFTLASVLIINTI